MKFFRLKFILVSSLSIFLFFIFLLFLFHYQSGMWHLLPIKIDYAQLERLLATQKWIEADRETALIYKKIVRKHLEEEGLYGLRKLDFLGQRQVALYMGELPCHKLKKLDRLWLKYSDRYFGFSVQAQILKDITSNNQLDSFDKSMEYSGLIRKLETWGDSDNRSIEHRNPLIIPEKFKGYLPSNLWSKYTPSPNGLNINKSLIKFTSCIDTKVDI